MLLRPFAHRGEWFGDRGSEVSERVLDLGRSLRSENGAVDEAVVFEPAQGLGEH